MTGAQAHGKLSSSAQGAIVLLVLALVIAATRGIWFGNPVATTDEQLYSLIGNGMLRGELPYVDNWDRKPFGLFALFALAHAIGGPGPIAFQAMAALFTLGGALLVFVLARPLAEWISALAAAVLYVALMAAYGSQSGQSEALFVPLMLSMVWLVRDPDHPRAFARACWAMLIGGLALQIKYTVFPQCAALGLWVLWHQFRRGLPLLHLARNALVFAALGLLPTIAVAVFYAAIGEWDAFLFANFISFFDRAPSPEGRASQGLFEIILPLVVLAALGLYATLRLRRPDDMRSYALYVIWFISCAATAFLPATVYGYYFAAMVPGAVLVSLPLLDRRGPLGPIPVALLHVAMIFILALPQRYATSKQDQAAAERMETAISPLVDANRCLFVFDGPTSLYRMSGSCHPTRYIYPDHLNNALERGSLGVSQVTEVRRILANAPPVVVTADTPFTPQNEQAKGLVDRAVAQDYAPLVSAEIGGRTIRAWRLRD